MELRQLKYFIAVAEELNFTKAAKRVHVSQPPLSRQIRNLEEELGFPLLERTQHRVTLTDAGRGYYEQVKRGLQVIDHARGMAEGAAKGEIGNLAVGFGGSAAYSFLPHVLRTFKQKFPLVHLALEPIATAGQLQAIKKNKIDVGILMHPSASETADVHTRVLLRDRMVVALPVGHRLVKRKQISLRELAEENFVTLPASGGGGGYRMHLLEVCRRSGFVPNIAQEAPQIETAIGLVAVGIGVAVVSNSARWMRLADVEYRPIRDQHALAEFVLAWRKSESSAPVRAFLEVAEHCVQQWAIRSNRNR